MVYTELTKKAMNIAYKVHDGQFDKCGFPYICHPIHVAEMVSSRTEIMLRYLTFPNLLPKDSEKISEEIMEYATCIALLHDVIEDTDITLDDLAKEFPEEVVHAVDLLTHKEGVDYFDYIKEIDQNYLARIVKVQDLLHNMDPVRTALIDGDPDKKNARLEKYRAAIKILCE